jgi:hypothetical protein
VNDNELTFEVTNQTAAAVLTLLREDIAAMRKDNGEQHAQIVHRLDTINGRVQKHDREIATMYGKTQTIDKIAEQVDHIDRNYLGRTAAWTGFTAVVGGIGAVLFWLLEHVTFLPQ